MDDRIGTPADVEQFVAWATAAQALLADRPDLVERIGVEITRVRRATCLVAVIGEFKQGKSSLINSLLGESVCPTDDHMATSVVTVIGYAPVPSVQVRRRDAEGRSVVASVDPAERREIITADVVAGDDGTAVAGGVERVDIGIPNELLKRGIVLVDTPGVGGLRPSHAAASRGFLRHADVLVFVSDATSELTAVELDFLSDALDACPNVCVALTKTDLFPEWPRVVERTRAHLDGAGVAGEIYPVSYPLRVEALRSGDASLSDESGYPVLRDTLLGEMAPRARSSALDRAEGAVRRCVQVVSEGVDLELGVLGDERLSAHALAELQQRQNDLALLVDGAARWRTILQDQVTDLTHGVTHDFRARVRRAVEVMDGAIDAAAGRDELDAAAEALQAEVVDAAADAFEAIETGIVDVASQVGGSLGLDGLDVGRPEEIVDAAREAAAAWVDPGQTDGKRSVAGDTLAAVRGAQGGVLMLVVMGGLLPAAAATAVAAAPFMIGAGVLFGGKQLLDVRSQRKARARQQVKLALRKSVDELQFTVNAELSEALRAAQRHLRDELAVRIEEIHRATADAVEHLKRLAAGEESARSARKAELTERGRVLSGWASVRPARTQEPGT